VYFIPYRYVITELKNAIDGQTGYQLEFHEKSGMTESVLPVLLTKLDLDRLYEFLCLRKLHECSIEVEVLSLEEVTKPVEDIEPVEPAI
jgi:hypothetical protein